jgi:copper resistance protein D
LVTWLSIIVKALVYATAFLAMGSVLNLLTVSSLPASEVRKLWQMSVVWAMGAVVFSVLRVPP